MRRWPLFRNRDYMLFWSGQALSELGSQTSTVAYPLLVLTLTGSAAKAGEQRARRTDRRVRLAAPPAVLPHDLPAVRGRQPRLHGPLPAAILLAKRHGASAAAVGAMFAIVGAGGVLGALAAAPARRRLCARAVIAGGEWILLVCVLPLLVARSAVVIGLLVAAAEFVTPIGNSVVAGSRVAATPDHLQGRVAAVSATVAMSLGWLGPLAVGFAFQHAGASTTILAVALWSAVLAAAATVAPALRSGPPAPVPAGRHHDQAETDGPAPTGEATSPAG